MKKLKNLPLALQIWMVFAAVIVIIYVLLTAYFSITIRRFFTDEMYKTIEVAQKNTIQKNTGKAAEMDVNQAAVSNDIREVKHIRLNYYDNAANVEKIEKVIPNSTTAGSFLKKLMNQVKNQEPITQRYIQRTNSGRILYVVRINRNNRGGNFIVSYMWDTYRNSLSTSLIKRIFSVMVIALIISLIAAKYLAQRLVVPLRTLESKVKKIGKKQWYESIHVDREDEIGELSRSIEEMRKELVKQDEYEQTMLQQASHDLKTPLMVIRSYAQAVEDGIYPKGDLASTMKVIDSEAARMQKRVKNLLYLTKIKFLTKHADEVEEVYMKDIVERIVAGFIYNEKNITFEVHIDDVKVRGDEEQWAVIFENIIDNELRYAKSVIRINVYGDEKGQHITIYNDGEHIPEDNTDNIFDTFNKDKGGNFGLGLDIVRRIVNMYNGTVKAQNEVVGVSFIITLPYKKNFP